MKQCSKCLEVKPREDFSVDSRLSSGLRSQCKRCIAEYTNSPKRRDAMRQYYIDNNINEKRRQIRKERGPRYYADLKRKSTWGLTPEDFDAKIAEQDGKCAICRKDFDLENEPKKVHVDHSHSTNAIRGLLCNHCNLGLGHFFDSQESLLSAMDYLKKWSN